MDVVLALLALGDVENDGAGKFTLVLRINDRINSDQPLALDTRFGRRLGGKLDVGDGFAQLKNLIEQGSQNGGAARQHLLDLAIQMCIDRESVEAGEIFISPDEFVLAIEESEADRCVRQ